MATQPLYHGDIAHIGARLSNLAYDIPLRISEGVQRVFDPTEAVMSISTFQKDDFRVLVVSSDDAIFVVFRERSSRVGGV